MTNYTIHDLDALVAEWRTRTARGESAWTVPAVHGSDIELRLMVDGSSLAVLYPAGGFDHYANIRDQDLAEGDDLDAVFAHNIGVWLTSPSARGEASR